MGTRLGPGLQCVWVSQSLVVITMSFIPVGDLNRPAAIAHSGDMRFPKLGTEKLPSNLPLSSVLFECTGRGFRCRKPFEAAEPFEARSCVTA